eukprot:1816303-Pleurochrysis_carterae.AAC.1
MASPDLAARPVYPTPAVYTVTKVAGRPDDARAFPDDAPVLTSLPFLPWEHVSPTTACLPGWIVTNLCLMA